MDGMGEAHPPTKIKTAEHFRLVGRQPSEVSGWQSSLSSPSIALHTIPVAETMTDGPIEGWTGKKHLELWCNRIALGGVNRVEIHKCPRINSNWRTFGSVTREAANQKPRLINYYRRLLRLTSLDATKTCPRHFAFMLQNLTSGRSNFKGFVQVEVLW
jgi:hypothetical protein